MIAGLVRRFGMDHLALVEAAVQDAAVRALERWEGPATRADLERWLFRVAHNAVVDALRCAANAGTCPSPSATSKRWSRPSPSSTTSSG